MVFKSTNLHLVVKQTNTSFILKFYVFYKMAIIEKNLIPCFKPWKLAYEDFHKQIQ